MLYMLDTNICIYVMKHHPPEVRERLYSVSVDDVVISSIVLAELRYGLSESLHKQKNEIALSDFLHFCRVLDWPSAAAVEYGDIRSQLESRGQIIGANDLLIAAHALHIKATLITNNLDEFKRVPGLFIENWLKMECGVS